MNNLSQAVRQARQNKGRQAYTSPPVSTPAPVVNSYPNPGHVRPGPVMALLLLVLFLAPAVILVVKQAWDSLPERRTPTATAIVAPAVVVITATPSPVPPPTDAPPVIQPQVQPQPQPQPPAARVAPQPRPQVAPPQPQPVAPAVVDPPPPRPTPTLPQLRNYQPSARQPTAPQPAPQPAPPKLASKSYWYECSGPREKASVIVHGDDVARGVVKISGDTVDNGNFHNGCKYMGEWNEAAAGRMFGGK